MRKLRLSKFGVTQLLISRARFTWKSFWCQGSTAVFCLQVLCLFYTRQVMCLSAMRPIIHLLMCSIISVIDLPFLHSRHQNTVTSSTDSDPPPRSPHPRLAGTQRHGQVPGQWDEVHDRWRSGQWQHWRWHITPRHGIKAFWRKWPPEENQVEPGEGREDGVWQGREVVPSRKNRPPRPEKGRAKWQCFAWDHSSVLPFLYHLGSESSAPQTSAAHPLFTLTWSVLVQVHRRSRNQKQTGLNV